MVTLTFDLDGTLSDPAVGIGRSLNYALEAFGHPALSALEVPRYIGPPLDWAFRQIVPNASHDTVLSLVAKYRERYQDVGYAENSLYPGIAEALAHLSTRGVQMGVCTSKRTDFAEKILEIFCLRHYFQFVAGGDIGITKGQQLRALLERGAICPSSTMIGDRAVDIEAAHANGLRAVGILWGHGTRAELVTAGSDGLLENPSDFASLLEATP
ncbi:MAG: HAD hydrolase-like protein [Vicinamibacterales bacterium]